MTLYADISLELLEAIFTRLAGDTPLNALITGAYSHPPEAITPPYVLISPPRLQPRAARGLTVAQGEITLTLWSMAHKMVEAHTIAARLQTLLTEGSPLALTPHYLTVLRLVELQIHRETQRTLRGSVLRFTLWIEGA